MENYIDSGGRRLEADRRNTAPVEHYPERRSGGDRRSGKDRRRTNKKKINSAHVDTQDPSMMEKYLWPSLSKLISQRAVQSHF